MKKIYVWGMFILCIATLAFIYGCGSNPTGGGSSSAFPRIYRGMDTFNGSIIKWTINDGTFSATIEDGPNKGVYFSGTYTTLLSGVISADVTTSSNITAIPTNDSAHVVEMPNVSLLVNYSDNLIVNPVAVSSAPTFTNGSATMIPWQGWDNAPFPGHQIYYATVEVSGSNPNYTFKTYYYDAEGDFIVSSSESNFQFSNGRFINTVDPNVTQIFANSLGIICGSNGSGESGGFLGGKIDTTITTTEIVSHNYKGINNSVDYTASNTADIKILIAEGVANTNKLQVFTVDDITLALSTTNRTLQGTVEVFDQDDDSIFPCVFTGASTGWTLPLYLQASRVNGKIMCTGTVTAETADNAVDIILYQQ